MAVTLIEDCVLEARREDLVRDLRHRFNALLGVSLFSWATMAGLLVFVWIHGQVLGVKSFSWFIFGVFMSMLQLVFLVFVAFRLHSTMKVRSSLLSNLEYASEHDSLTGLINRRGFEFYLKESLLMASRQRHSLTLLYLDLDGFKQVNDSHGHAVGDRLLRAVASNWGEVVRGGDILARLGGDEFVLLTSAIGSEVEALSERLISVAKASRMDEISDLQIGVSIGVAEFPLDGKDATSLVLAADSAMLDAKGLGKSCFQRAMKASDGTAQSLRSA